MGSPPKSLRSPKRRDEKFEGLKRRIVHLARFEGAVVHLAEGPFLVQLRGVSDVRRAVTRLAEVGRLDRAELAKLFAMAAEPFAISPAAIAVAHRDLRALAQKPALALAREHRRALARYGAIDAAWLAEKEARIALANAALRAPSLSPEEWFEGAIELVDALHGARDAARLREAGARLRVLPEVRRREARARVDALVRALETDEAPDDPELAHLASALDAARDLPGRARRRKALDVIRRAVDWPAAPSDLAVALGGQDASGDAFAASFAEAGRAAAARLPTVRDAAARERALVQIAQLALAFPRQDADEDGAIPLPDLEDEAAQVKRHELVLSLAPDGRRLGLARALALTELELQAGMMRRVGKLVGDGLDLDLVRDLAARKLVPSVVQLSDVRTARAYATWATRLAAHYESQGITFTLSPELFTNLPRNEDLAVLSLCLMGQLADAPKDGANKGDPIAVLDATLALFEKLPQKAQRILKRLRASAAGEGRRHAPAFAAWLDDDALLDRYLHVASLAGQRPLLSSAIREDFEHEARAAGELAHLEKLEARSVPQQGRLDALRRSRRTLAGSPTSRTKRRLAERIERLLPLAYRRELDLTFREILRDAWGIDMPSLTPAWRDAVRFWLVVEDNRDLLGKMLKEASAGRPVKAAFPANAAWIAEARRRFVVDAWLAPRRTFVDAGKSRYVLELEEDPLEVLRMGIPFATCLALDTGSNAASTVLNAIEANKRVLYVRNAAGNVVARKLLAISKDFRLIGFNLYVSVAGEDETAIRAAVLETCKALARECGVPLANAGVPAQLHEGFWYDDGAVAFAEDVEVADYTSALGLPPPPAAWESLTKEAAAWRARERGDVEAAIAALTSWDSGPANRALGAWVVDRLGQRAAEKLGAEDSSVVFALFRALADEGEDGLVRALDAGLRFATHTHGRLLELLRRFPPSTKLAGAFADVALRATKRSTRGLDQGIGHASLSELPRLFDDVASALDLLDTVEPAWDHIAREVPSCENCCLDARLRAANVVEAIYARAPDPDVVVGALMSRRRGAVAHGAALRVAARHELPGGARALVRFAALRPEHARSPDGLAAILRQTPPGELPPRAPPPLAAPLEAMRDLVLDEARHEGIERLARGFVEPKKIDDWKPGPWELAFRARRAAPRESRLREALFERAARTPDITSRPLELLALLGDVERVAAATVGRREDATPTSWRSPWVPASKEMETLAACRAAAAAIAAQVAITRGGVLEAIEGGDAPPRFDAGYVDLAQRTLASGDASDEARELARGVVLATKGSEIVDWHRLLGAVVRAGDGVTAARVLEARATSGFYVPAETLALAWQLPEARAAVATTIGKAWVEGWSARVWAVEREAAARGLDAHGLLEEVALALAASGRHEGAIEAETVDQLREIAGALVGRAAPADVAKAIEEMDDVSGVALFVRAFRRQPLVRQAALRDAIGKLAIEDPRGEAFARWFVSHGSRGQSLRTSGASSIERA